MLADHAPGELIMAIALKNEYLHLQDENIRIKREFGYNNQPGTEGFKRTYNSYANEMIKLKLSYYEEKNLPIDDYVFATVTRLMNLKKNPLEFEGEYTNSNGETKSLEQLYNEYKESKNE